MQERTKTGEEDRERTDALTDLIRRGAQQLLAQALKVEVAELLATYADQRDEPGPARVVLSGHHPARGIQTGIGPVPVPVPKVRSRQGQPVTFHLKGISTGERQPALEALVGLEAQGLSASTVSRLKQIWREEYNLWRQRRLEAARWIYLWVDGIYRGLRAEEHRLCA